MKKSENFDPNLGEAKHGAGKAHTTQEERDRRKKRIERMQNSANKYFAFQDKNIGYIQWIGQGHSEIEVAESFKKDVEIWQSPAEIIENMEITELTDEQFKALENCDGTDQDAIELLESYKNKFCR